MVQSVCLTVGDSQAETILRKLRKAGFSRSDISVLKMDADGSGDFVNEHDIRATEDTSTEVFSGTVVTGSLRWPPPIRTLMIPGPGLVIAAGNIIAALRDSFVSERRCGIAGELIGIGVPDAEARRFEERIRAGRTFISVDCNDGDEFDLLTAICEQAEAEPVRMTTEMASQRSSVV